MLISIQKIFWFVFFFEKNQPNFISFITFLAKAKLEKRGTEVRITWNGTSQRKICKKIENDEKKKFGKVS
jgi:hypothetical protein